MVRPQWNYHGLHCCVFVYLFPGHESLYPEGLKYLPYSIAPCNVNTYKLLPKYLITLGTGTEGKNLQA